jgi:uncharacterized membrane protein YeaQ/YmgE (transglycosylase-associated protein family)
MESAMPEAEIGWIAAIIVGGLAGWLAEMFMKSGTGILMNFVLGIVVAALASWPFGHRLWRLVGLFGRRLYRGLHHHRHSAGGQRADGLVRPV